MTYAQAKKGVMHKQKKGVCDTFLLTLQQPATPLLFGNCNARNIFSVIEMTEGIACGVYHLPNNCRSKQTLTQSVAIAARSTLPNDALWQSAGLDMQT